MRSAASRVLCCSLALSLAAPAGASPHSPSGSASATAPASDTAQRARDAFSEGLRLVQAGDYSAALAAFARAQALEPHPLALYNMGQCQARLGRYAAAVDTLESFLAQGGAAIEPAQRSAVTRQVAELRARVAAEAEAEPARPPAAAAVPTQPVPPAPSSPLTPPPSSPLASPPSSPPSGAVAVPERSRTWGWLLSGTGLTFVASATALYLWNDHRYQTWRADRDALEGVPDRELLVQQDPATWDETHASNERLASIQRVDVGSGILAGVGATALAFGIWQLLAADGTSAEQPDSQTSASPFAWRLSW